MRPVEQSRIGRDGTCFRACLASILNLRERDVPDWPQANGDPGVNVWLAGRGLRYTQVPIVPGAPAPVGWHTIEGTSPRGGQHAVVGYNGRFVHDPHPVSDDPRRGLVRPMYWGLLTPVAKAADCLPIEYCPRCGNDAERCKCPDKTALLSGFTLGDDPRTAKDAVSLRPDKDGEMQLRYTARDRRGSRWQ